MCSQSTRPGTHDKTGAPCFFEENDMAKTPMERAQNLVADDIDAIARNPLSTKTTAHVTNALIAAFTQEILTLLFEIKDKLEERGPK